MPQLRAPAPRAISILLTFVLLALAGQAGATPAPKPDLLGSGATTDASLAVGGQSQPIYGASVTESYDIPTSYGTIRGDVRRPVVPAGVTVPIILTYTPYTALYQSLAPTRASRAHDTTGSFFVPRGYARAVFDVVGTFGSEGCTDFGGLGERETGAAVVEFLAAQPWANGKVGMIGASYDGTTAIATAVEAPEHLVTIIPQVAIDRWYDYMYNDGVRMTLEDNATGLADPPIDSPADYDLLYGVVPPYHLLADDPVGVAAVLADHMTPCNRVENQLRGHETDPVYDEFWIERDYRALADEVTASVLLEGAWLDDNVKHWATTRFFQALTARQPADPDDPLPQTMMTIGQWSHSTSQFSFASDLRHSWFDHHLLGLETDVTAMPAVITGGSDGLTSAHDQWPPAEVSDRSLQLGSADLPLRSGSASWTDIDPAMVEQIMTRDLCIARCARFQTPAANDTARIMGEPTLQLTLTTDDVSTHLAAVLYDVSPSGTRIPISRGLLNTGVREGLDRWTALPVGDSYTAAIAMWPVDHGLARGHALELVLSSTNATWGLSDTTRATTVVDLTSSTLHLPWVATS